MLFSRVSPLLLGLLVASLAACTAGTNGPGVPAGEGPAPGTPSPGGPTNTSEEARDEESKPDEPGTPALDKTPRFELTLDGEAVTIASVKVTIKPATNLGPAKIVIDGSYEQDLAGPMTSTATFTIRADVTAKGKDACGSSREASYWFKDTDGSLRGMGTSYQGGSCMMDIVANQADGFSAGSAQGTIGGVTTKAFSVRWGQALPAK